MTDYTKEAELMKLSNMLSKYHLEVDSVEGIGEKGTIQLSHARKFLDYAARQQSAAEIDRLRGEVEKLREGLAEVDKSLYIGDDLKDKEVLDFYVEVVKNCKEYIKLLLTETEG